jgi:hypothetical protein
MNDARERLHFCQGFLGELAAEEVGPEERPEQFMHMILGMLRRPGGRHRPLGGDAVNRDELPAAKFLKRERREVISDVRLSGGLRGLRHVEQIARVVDAGAHRGGRLIVLAVRTRHILVYRPHSGHTLRITSAVPGRPQNSQSDSRPRQE